MTQLDGRIAETGEVVRPSAADELLPALDIARPLASWTMTFRENRLENVGVARTAVATYLRFVVPVLTQAEVSDEAVDNAELCTSEVVTDAVVHGGKEGVTHVKFFAGVGAVAISVGSGRAENGSTPQIKHDVPSDAESGRGLEIVEICSRDMGWFPVDPETAPDHTAIETWFLIDTQPSVN